MTRFFEPQLVTADDLQDAVIHEIQGIERYSDTFNSNKADPFLAELSSVANLKREKVEALGQRPFTTLSI